MFSGVSYFVKPYDSFVILGKYNQGMELIVYTSSPIIYNLSYIKIHLRLI